MSKDFSELSELSITWVDAYCNEHEEEIYVTFTETPTRYMVCYDLNEWENVVYDVNTVFSLRLKQDDEGVIVSSDFYIMRDFVLVVFKKE